MKKLTLNQAWTLCLRQWKWRIQQLGLGDETSIAILKRRWVERNDFTDVRNDCFFCEYAAQNGGSACSSCPGTLVSSQFRCWRDSYSYELQPRKFYAMLLELNKKRKKWYHKLWCKIF